MRFSRPVLPLAVLALASATAACGADDNHHSDAFVDTPADGTDGIGACTNGDTRCYVFEFQSCAGGAWSTTQDCSLTGHVCDDDLGCVDCIPGRNFCEGTVSMECDSTGFGGTPVEDCALEPGTWCDAASGTCINECEQAVANRSNIGCEYWAVDLDNAENSFDDAAAGQFAVVVANVNLTYNADVWVYRDISNPGEPMNEVQVDYASVLTSGLHIFRLPRLDVDGEEVTEHVDDGPQTAISKRVYRIVSSVPVVAYQFNPIDQRFSNDASLLLPTTGLGNLYHVVTWPPANPIALPGLSVPNRCYVTIVSIADGTLVHVTPTYDVEASTMPIQPGFQAVSAMTAGTTYDFVLNRYEVLNLENHSALMPLPDLTGTVVEADADVVVFSGVDLAVVDDGTGADGCCAEHMEMQVIPKTAMGKQFVVSHSAWRGSGAAVEPDVYRILAVRDGTHLTTSIPSTPTIALNANEWIDVMSKTGFVLESLDYPVQIVQVLIMGQLTQNFVGDSTFVPIPAVEERRGYYIFTTGEGFSENWAVVSMPDGTFATIDGAVVDAHCDEYTDGTLGAITFRSYYCPIADGAHVVDSGEVPVGVYVYGYYNAGSYGYPAGSDLREIFLE